MQKTINGTIIVITLLSTIGTHLKAGNFEGMMTLRVNGHSLSSGMYIIHISAQSLESEEMFTQSQKVVLLK